MKLTPQLLQTFGIGFVAGAILFTSLVQIVFGRSRRAREIAAARAFSQRSGNSQRSYPTVRQTDNKSRMTRGESTIFHRAEKLVVQRKYLEAAELFEKIRFQRRAIDVLEEAGLITEAAQILLRLKVPGRAAILYERNGRLEFAAKYFQIANQHCDAGLALLKLALIDSKFYGQAAESFTIAKEYDRALEALAQLLNHDEILRNAIMHSRYRFLFNYMQSYLNARAILEKIGENHLDLLVQSASFSPHAVQTFATWTECSDRPRVARSIIEHVSRDRAFSTQYWNSLSPTAKQGTIERLQKPKVRGSLRVRNFCEHLVATGTLKAGAKIFFINEDYVDAASIYLQFGGLNMVYASVEKSGYPEFAEEIARIIGDSVDGPWTQDQVASVSKIVEKLLSAHSADAGPKNQKRLRQAEQAVQEFMESKKHSAAGEIEASPLNLGKKAG
jgi:tetratricopeptide (TPR) repeat protein